MLCFFQKSQKTEGGGRFVREAESFELALGKKQQGKLQLKEH